MFIKNCFESLTKWTNLDRKTILRIKNEDLSHILLKNIKNKYESIVDNEECLLIPLASSNNLLTVGNLSLAEYKSFELLQPSWTVSVNPKKETIVER